jgi:hypothetical protein
MASAEPDASPTPTSTTSRSPAVQELVLLALLVLSTVGVAISQLSPAKAFRYWIVMVPIFGAVSLFSGWSSARAGGMTASGVVGRQIMHWAALAVAVCLVFLLQATGRMGEADAGTVTLLSLALATFLAGVHFDWRYCVVGALLAAAVAAIAVVSNFLWLIGIVAVAFAVFLALRASRASSSAGPP